MNKVRNEAYKLRVAGHSYNEINSKLGIAKSTLSGWFKELVISDKAQERLRGRIKEGSKFLIKRNKLQTKKAWERAYKTQLEASSKIGTLSDREILLIGTALYWGEGYKKLKVVNGKEIPSHSVSFTNADPEMIKIFLRFIFQILEIPRGKVRVNMRLYKHINEKSAQKYWQAVTGLPIENFEKSTHLVSRSSEGRRPFNRLPYGTLNVRVGDTPNFHKIIGYIEGIKNSGTL